MSTAIHLIRHPSALVAVIACMTMTFLHLLEILKEKKRQEYVQKQKAKLASYQSKVKSEAEKIQVSLSH